MGEMTKWFIKLGVGALVSLGLTYASGKMMNRLLKDLCDDETSLGNKNKAGIEMDQKDYEVR